MARSTRSLSLATPTAATSTAATEPRQRVFVGAIVVRCFDYVAAAVAGLIRLEVIELLRTT